MNYLQRQNVMIWTVVAVGGILGYLQAGDGVGAFFGSFAGVVVLVIYFAISGWAVAEPQAKPTVIIEGIKCITCQSTNVVKISAGQKMGHVLAFGIFAPAFKKVRSQFECKNCGYKW